MTVQIVKRGKARRLRSKRAMEHRPSETGKGKWHSRTSLWAYKRKARRVRKMADESRRRNRTV